MSSPRLKWAFSNVDGCVVRSFQRRESITWTQVQANRKFISYSVTILRVWGPSAIPRLSSGGLLRTQDTEVLVPTDKHFGKPGMLNRHLFSSKEMCRLRFLKTYFNKVLKCFSLPSSPSTKRRRARWSVGQGGCGPL